ncbi:MULTISPECIES: VOC family protein [unclassified Streptomyces]|uniref:VOC family protein n=1 Tax=unclassified Streptomyces TaxID=2593676 RepID=UPI002E12892B|nr:VOC family protein [Streptomyces sp. NBC_01207]WTA16840.1 VOC family protein [Streptomyces sp. NBC_00853]
MTVQPVPEGYPRVTPYLCIDGAAAAIDFYGSVLGVRERMRMAAPGGKIGHAELELGSSVIMLADEYPDIGFRSPKSVGGTPVTLHVYVEDVDAVFAKALALGATELRPIKDEFYGDRTGQFEDPFGHRWNIATHIEDVPPDEMEKRSEEAERAMQSKPGGE